MALRISQAEVIFNGTARVTFVKRLQMTRISSYPSGVRGNAPSKSMTRAAKGSVAGNNHMGAVLCVPMRRFFAQVGHAGTQPKTSAANEGQQQ